jgi:hypothetical protein
MKLLPTTVCAALAAVTLADSAPAADWITAPSYYTHDWETAERVTQFAPIAPVYYVARPDFLQSGYRHYRSTINLGNSLDNLHLVEEWGRPVRPYDEWRFPYRPYSVPYDQWGPPFGGLEGAGIVPFPFGGFGGGVAPPFVPGHGGGRRQQPAVNFAQPWLDGHYPQYDANDRTPYWRPYTAPRRP